MAQENRVESKAYNTMLKALLSHSVKEVSVATASQKQQVVFLDARERQEYEVSHIENAIWVGYEDFALERVRGLDKEKEIIIYCSVGKRSENIAVRLEKEGFTNVSNLYGGIFEWINQEQPVYNSTGKTLRIHPYNFFWGMWLSEGEKYEGD